MIRCARLFVTASFFVSLVSIVACSRSEDAAAPPSSASASATKTSAPAAASASAAPQGSAAPAAAPAASAAAECGTRPLPDCPLQAWMKANANPASLGSDNAALAAALEKMVAFAPPGYTNWASIAHDGATAARSGDRTAAKGACRSCHDQYKQKYKTEMRARKVE